jgi:hypothetical protein
MRSHNSLLSVKIWFPVELRQRKIWQIDCYKTTNQKHGPLLFNSLISNVKRFYSSAALHAHNPDLDNFLSSLVNVSTIRKKYFLRKVVNLLLCNIKLVRYLLIYFFTIFFTFKKFNFNQYNDIILLFHIFFFCLRLVVYMYSCHKPTIF